MSFADKTAVAVPPILLRLVLAITFLWAGLGKVMETQDFQGENAARLANLGVEWTTPAITPPEGLPEDGMPVEPLDLPPADDVEARGPGADTGADADAATFAFVRTQDTDIPGDLPSDLPADLPTDLPDPTPSTPAPAPPQYSAADFPAPVTFKRVAGLALLIDRATNPSPAADGTRPSAIWPDWAGKRPWPVVLAWAAAVTEILAAVLLLLGFLTRLAGLSLAGTMVVAAWLTQIGPAMQAGTTTLGFLPAYDAFDIAAWTPLLWQFALFCCGAALVFSGSGALALDRLGKRRDDDEEES